MRLFTSEANVHKRLQRARDRLRESSADHLTSPPLEGLRMRLASVHEVLYLLFNEGYLSAHAESAIRRELCDEALRLAALLAEHLVGAVPETFALLALMHFHAARFAAAFQRHRARALSAAPTDAVRELLRRRWSGTAGTSCTPEDGSRRVETLAPGQS